MPSPSRRRSDRVSLTVLLEASGTDSHGQEFSEAAKTLLINRGGAVIVFGRELKTEQQIHIRRKAPSEAHRQSRVRHRQSNRATAGWVSLQCRDFGSRNGSLGSGLSGNH